MSVVLIKNDDDHDDDEKYCHPCDLVPRSPVPRFQRPEFGWAAYLPNIRPTSTTMEDHSFIGLIFFALTNFSNW